MIKRAKELLRLAADGTHVSSKEWVPVVEALVNELESDGDYTEEHREISRQSQKWFYESAPSVVIAESPEPKP